MKKSIFETHFASKPKILLMLDKDTNFKNKVFQTLIEWHEPREIPYVSGDILNPTKIFVITRSEYGLRIYSTVHLDNKERVKFSTDVVIAWAYADDMLEKIENAMKNTNFNAEWIDFLHNNVMNL